MPADVVSLVEAVPGTVAFGLGPSPLGPPLLVVPAAERGRLEQALAGAGWRAKGSCWARFGGGEAEQLDTLTAPPEELCAALPPLARELLLRALAAPAHGPAVPAGYRAEAHRSLAAAPAAWLLAHDGAPASLRSQVVTLQDAYETGLPLGTPPGAAQASWPGATVALSGLDGAGKTTQAHLLATALSGLGHDPAVEWARLGFSPGLERVAGAAKAVLGRARFAGRARPAAPADATPEGVPDTAPVGARRTVTRPPAVEAPWSVLVAGADVRDTRRRAATHAWSGRVVVRDRYLLDSLVHLADRYGDGVTLAARRVLRAGLPAPACAFLLELPADVAFTRKPGEWRLADLERHAQRYADLADELGVVRLDARRPAAELAAVIAEAVWRAVP